MELFFKNRLQSYQKQMFKYLKYVLNDHIVLVLIFLLGGFGYYYGAFVKTLTPDFWLGKWLVIIISFACLWIGRFATYLKEADRVFLLPKETEMKEQYLKKAYQYTLFFPFVCLLIVQGVFMPMLIATEQATFIDFLLAVACLWLLKASQLVILGLSFLQGIDKQQTKKLLIWSLFSGIILVINSYISPIVGLGLSGVFYYICLQDMNKQKQAHLLDWDLLILKEQGRLKRIYQLINLFTDVPGISTQVRRRKYLDPLLAKLSYQQKNTYLYLYMRSFLRGTEYSGLFLRLTLIGSVLIGFIQEWPIQLAVGCLFIYLIGFQLVPLYNQYDYMLLTQLYPISLLQKEKAVKQLILGLLVGVTIVYSIVLLLTNSFKIELGIQLAVLCLETGIMVGWYIPKRLRKIAGK